MCLMAEMSARSSVSSLRSLSVHLDLRPLLGLTTLVAALINSSKRGSYMHGTVACLWGPQVLTLTSRYQTRKNAGNTGLAHTASAVR